MADSATATIRIPVSAASYAAAIEGLTRINQRILSAARNVGGHVAPLYQSGVRYKREPRDVWRHIGDVYKSGWGDCEDLAAARVSQLRVSGEDPRSYVAVYQSGPRRYHAIVARGDGSTEDPSRRLGMKKGGKSPMGTLEGDEFDEETEDTDPYAELPPDEAEPTDVYDEPPEEAPEAFAPYEQPIQYDTPEEPFTPARARGQDIDAWPMTRPAPDEPYQPAPAQPMRPAAPPPMRALPPKPKRKPKRKPPKRKPKKRKALRTGVKVLKAAALPHVFAHKAAFKFGRKLFGRKKKVRAQRRAKARAIAGYCEQHMERRPLVGHPGAWIGIGDDPNVGAGAQVTFDLYRSGQGWSGIVRVPLDAIRAGRPQAIVAKTTPTKARRMRAPTPAARQVQAKRATATKAVRLAAKISRLPGVQMLIPPQARAAMAVLKSPIGKLATKGAGKLLSKLF